MHGQRGGQAEGDFLGEGRAGDHGQRHVVAQYFRRDLVQEAAAAGFEALGGPGHARARGPVWRHGPQGFGEGMRWHHHQHQVGSADAGGQVGGGGQRVRQGDARQVNARSRGAR
jgi:hypothetical protein